LGYLVTVVENGKLAMDVLANAELLPPGHPDRLAILLLDLEMPVMGTLQM
jgi:CheY-like chemotaxis protein